MNILAQLEIWQISCSTNMSSRKNHSLHHRVKSHDMFFKVKVVKETDDKKTTLGIGMDNYTCLAVLCFLDG